MAAATWTAARSQFQPARSSLLLLIAGASWLGGLIVLAFVAAAFAVIAASRATAIPAILGACVGRGRRPGWISVASRRRQTLARWIGPMSTLRVYILVMRRMRPYAGRLALAIAEVLLIGSA